MMTDFSGLIWGNFAMLDVNPSAAAIDRIDLRRHARLPATVRIFARSGAFPFPSAVKNLSMGGAHVVTDAPMTVGEESVFAVHLPNHDAPLELNGHVVWASQTAMGVQFHANEPRLTDFVARLEEDAQRL